MIKNPHPGKFIAFEGIDGSGKSDQFSMAKEFILKNNKPAYFCKEPGPDRPTGKLVYALLHDKHPKLHFKDMTKVQRQRYYFADRIAHYFYNVIPALESGKNVICDRSFASIALEITSSEELRMLLAQEEIDFKVAEVPFIIPDRILIYDVSPEVAVERLNKKNRELDYFEQKSKMLQAREGYLMFANEFSDNCRVIDASPSVAEVFDKTQVVLKELL